MRALHSAERKDNLAPFSGKKPGRRVISLLLCLCMTIPMLFSLSDGFSMRANAAGSSSGTSGVTRQADPSTMDTYKEMLSFSENTRYAGRLWSDKTVFALDDTVNSKDENWNGTTLALTADDDGVSDSVTLDEDFLHVYSVLGSSQNVNTENVRPLDVVLLLDISSSMEENNTLSTNALHQVINDANELIDTLMNVNNAPSIHKDNRVGVVVYGAGSQVLMPLQHYNKQGSTPFLHVEQDYLYGDNHYFPRITATAESYTQTSKLMLADSTYLQAALYQGMYMLATAEGTTIVENGKKVSRQPILIALTDGATNIVGATSTGPVNNAANQEITPNPTNIKWWDPLAWAQGKTFQETVPTQTIPSMDKHTSVIVPRYMGTYANQTHATPNGNPFYVVESSGKLAHCGVHEKMDRRSLYHKQ